MKQWHAGCLGNWTDTKLLAEMNFVSEIVKGKPTRHYSVNMYTIDSATHSIQTWIQITIWWPHMPPVSEYDLLTQRSSFPTLLVCYIKCGTRATETNWSMSKYTYLLINSQTYVLSMSIHAHIDLHCVSLLHLQLYLNQIFTKRTGVPQRYIRF